MDREERLISLGELSTFEYCPRAWLLSILDERDDPDVRRLVHLVTSSGANPRAVQFFSDWNAGRGATGGGCLIVPALIVGLVLAVGAAAHRLLLG